MAPVSNKIPPVIELKMVKDLAALEESYYGIALHIKLMFLKKTLLGIPKISQATSITCNCDQCEQYEQINKSAVSYSFQQKLFVRASGCSRIKNLGYIDVFSKQPNSGLYPVECTPVL